MLNEKRDSAKAVVPAINIKVINFDFIFPITSLAVSLQIICQGVTLGFSMERSIYLRFVATALVVLGHWQPAKPLARRVVEVLK